MIAIHCDKHDVTKHGAPYPQGLRVGVGWKVRLGVFQERLGSGTTRGDKSRNLEEEKGITVEGIQRHFISDFAIVG